MTKPMNRRIRVLAAFLIVCAAAAGGAWGQAKGPTQGDPVKGKKVFLARCAICHQPDGTGGKQLVQGGNPSRNFHDAKFWESKTDDQLRGTINNGVAKS